jgi:pSer/pThr/pTyr-binding forkhead associated (FHA) protein
VNIWIDVLSRHGEVAARSRIDGPEARIGRAFDNDVVVDDPHVAPHHVRICRGEDGELVAEDLGTLNGLYAEHDGKRQARLSLARSPGIRIGRTVLRVHDAMRPVEPERLLTPPRAHARWSVGLGIALIAALLLVQWLGTTTQLNANVLLLPILGLATGIAVWSALWAIQSRLFLGQARYALHLRIALTACLALVAWDQIAETVSFAFASRGVAEYGGLAAWALLGAACYAHLKAIGTRHMNFAMSLVVALLLAGATLQYVGRSETQKLIGQRATLGDLRPPAFRAAPLASADEFFQRAEGAKRKVDELRAKEPPAGILSDLDPPD